MRADAYCGRRGARAVLEQIRAVRRGTRAALLGDMFINADQIVTATDRILLGNVTKRRATSDLTAAARLAVERSLANEERTIYVRTRARSHTLLAAAAALAWIAVFTVRLLA